QSREKMGVPLIHSNRVEERGTLDYENDVHSFKLLWNLKESQYFLLRFSKSWMLPWSLDYLEVSVRRHCGAKEWGHFSELQLGWLSVFASTAAMTKSHLSISFEVFLPEEPGN
ncbi:Hypothetical predicted protein, partial [Marmota monax]